MRLAQHVRAGAAMPGALFCFFAEKWGSDAQRVVVNLLRKQGQRCPARCSWLGIIAADGEARA